MDPEERLYAALDERQPETPPTISMSLDPNITNQALGRKPTALLQFLHSRRGARFVDGNARALNRFFDAAMFGFYNTCARANYVMGFDAMWFCYWKMGLRDHAHLQDAFGRLMDIVDDGFGNAYGIYRDGLIKSPGEWRAWPRPSIARYAATGAWMYRALRAIWGRRIAIVPFVAPGLWENSWQAMGFAPFITAMRRDPGFAREVVGYFTALSIACVDAYCAAGARVLTMGEDLAYKSGPMLSPRCSRSSTARATGR